MTAPAAIDKRKRPCVEHPDPDRLWFAKPGSAREREAVRACWTCPFMNECGDEAVSQGVPAGVWGGLTPRDREVMWEAGGGRPTGFDDWRTQWVAMYVARKAQIYDQGLHLRDAQDDGEEVA
jgi:hypothetical protein